MTTAQAFIGFDLAASAGDFSTLVVVERVFDRWRMGDIWLVEFDAFDPCNGVCTRDTTAFSSYTEAFNFRPGSIVSCDSDPDDLDGELPF